MSCAHDSTVSLSLTVRSDNPPSIVDHLTPHIDELVVVLASPSAANEEKWQDYLRDLSIPAHSITVSQEILGEMYAIDAPETFSVGESMVDEAYPGPFSQLPFILDWSAVRNIGWAKCSMKWKFAMVDDEVVVHPEKIRTLCDHLTAHQRDVAHIPHTCGKRIYSPARLARSDAGTFFENTSREILVGGQRIAVVRDSPQTISYPSQSVDQISLRSLYADARRSNWMIPHNSQLDLARCSVSTMPQLASTLLDLYLQSSPDAEDKAWALALRGEISESEGKLTDASRWYAESLSTYPMGWKSSMRLCRVLFKQSLWRECIDTYDNAPTNYPHLRDDSPLKPTSTLILVAASLHKIGKTSEARRLASSLIELFPDSSAVVNFYSTVTGA